MAPSLRLRLRPSTDRTICGPPVGAGLQAQLVLDLTEAIVVVRRSMLPRLGMTPGQAIGVAESQTARQPVHWSISSVTAGADAGSTLLIGGGGACTSGVIANLPATRLPGLRLPALVLVPNDHVVLVAQPPPQSSALLHAALAARLDHLRRSVTAVPPCTPPPHRRVLWCRGRGRLTMFDVEDL